MEYICNVSTIIYNSDYKQVVIFGFRNDDDSIQFNSTQLSSLIHALDKIKKGRQSQPAKKKQKQKKQIIKFKIKFKRNTTKRNTVKCTI